ncbi:ATP synthase F1 subunit delta [Blattabacterium cuenoti]|uniref:ATP synthase F1 subunit delta n=1 Tax=Blattabacterium cuenoti TaxID=1653831 RepID=UPI00163C83C4|nr:ATP synthase F1 subunit delta [Blattabacterium cuenoti]
MLNPKIINNYAKVLFEYSIKHEKNSCLFYKKIEKLYNFLLINFEFHQMFISSIISKKTKLKIIKKIYYDHELLIYKFIKLLIIRNREFFLKKIIYEYITIYKKHKGLINCLFISSTYINKKIQQYVLQKILNKTTYNIINKIDPYIIGGFILQIEWQEWDFSVKRQLFNIKNKFINNNID